MRNVVQYTVNTSHQSQFASNCFRKSNHFTKWAHTTNCFPQLKAKPIKSGGWFRLSLKAVPDMRGELKFSKLKKGDRIPSDVGFSVSPATVYTFIDIIHCPRRYTYRRANVCIDILQLISYRQNSKQRTSFLDHEMLCVTDTKFIMQVHLFSM